jgi:hypothetical protein
MALGVVPDLALPPVPDLALPLGAVSLLVAFWTLVAVSLLGADGG